MPDSVQELSALCAWPTGARVSIIAVLMGIAPFAPIVWKNTVHFWRSVFLLSYPYLPGGYSQIRTGAEDDSFIGHLMELHWRLLRVLSWVFAAFLLIPIIEGIFSEACGAKEWEWKRAGFVFFTGGGSIYSQLAVPLLNNLPVSGEIIAIGTVSPVLVPMKAAFFVAICAMMPYILREAWRFVAPGLYDNEKNLTRWLVASSTVLFYVGIMFAYFFVFQVVFRVIATVTPEAVNWTPDISELFGFMLLTFFTFGLAFEVPVAVFILVRAGVVELEKIRKARRGVIVGAFVVAAIVTPPDVLTQFLLAIPCWLLYEVGVWFSAKWAVPKPQVPSETPG